MNKDNKEKVDGKIGFDKKEAAKEKEIISKEETMFKIDNDGKVIPEKYQILIYDRELDRELIIEAEILMNKLKRKKATDKLISETVAQDNKEIETLKNKISKETDEKKKELLELKLIKEANISKLEELNTRINSDVLEEETKESREIINDLKAEKEHQKKEKYVELIPCTTSEAYLTFEQGKTIEGKATPDWVADLISKKCTNPKYTLEEAKMLKPDYKIAIKEGIGIVSNYKSQSYREIMLERRLKEEKPLTKKDELIR